MKCGALFVSRLFLSLVAATTASVAARSTEDCVLERNGVQRCTSVALATTDVPTTVRQKGGCARADAVCWCKRAVKLTNNYRRKNRVKVMLKLGPQAQMDNAMRYARVLSRLGKLKHQTLRHATREVKCKRWIGGENLAYNYARGDVARYCVDQWIKSKGHRANLLRGWFREMVVGFHFDKDGRVYCVQTFGLFFRFETFGKRNGPRCYPTRTA